jgi:hypothetical protein
LWLAKLPNASRDQVNYVTMVALEDMFSCFETASPHNIVNNEELSFNQSAHSVSSISSSTLCTHFLYPLSIPQNGQ